MTNREKLIKDLESMSDYKFAQFINDYVNLNTCEFCVYKDTKSCSDIPEPCEINITEWLKKEVDNNG